MWYKILFLLGLRKLHPDHVKILKQIVDGSFEPDTQYSGICSYIGRHTRRRFMTNEMSICFTNWEHFSGYNVFPIPSDIPTMDAVERFGAGQLWTGKQLEYRQSLAKHILTYFKAG